MDQGSRWIEYVALDELEDAVRNPNAHRLDELHSSIDRSGFVEPVVVDERTGRLVAGHGRKADLIARRDAGEPPPEGIVVKDGVWHVPVVRGWASSDDREAEAFLLASNLAPVWEHDLLSVMLDDLSESPNGLAGTGFGSIQVLLDQSDKHEIQEPDTVKLRPIATAWFLVCCSVADAGRVGNLLDEAAREIGSLRVERSLDD